MKLNFIYWFSFYNPEHPTARYRGQYVLDFFKSNYGINSYFIYPEYRLSRILKFLHAYFSALVFRKQNSLIVIQSVNSNFIYGKVLKFLIRVRNKNTVYDLDDADYLRYPPETIYYFIKNCFAVTVGSRELLKNISTMNSRTKLITCPVPDLNIVKEKKNNLLTIGWIGEFFGGHKESLLQFFFPALNDLRFQIKLVFLGVLENSERMFLNDYFRNNENVFLEMPENISWLDEEKVQHHISEFDIGIATLLDTEFFRSKSAFKAKQCLNNGVPVLSSDIPENNDFIEHGNNGFLCKSPEEFRQRIMEINNMSQNDYKRLSENAKSSIHKFDLKNFCDGLIRNCENDFEN